MNGQALVEFVVVLPVLLFTLLGALEAGFVIIQKAEQDRDTYLVAQWAAAHDNESWNAIANRELRGCAVAVSHPLPDVIEATSSCQYHPRTGLPLFDRLTIGSQETSSVPVATPAASPSSSSTT